MPPRAGILPCPLMADCTVASSPCFMRGIQASRSPIFGAPVTPAWWHLEHCCLTICSPDRPLAFSCAQAPSTNKPEAAITTASSVEFMFGICPSPSIQFCALRDPRLERLDVAVGESCPILRHLDRRVYAAFDHHVEGAREGVAGLDQRAELAAVQHALVSR